MEAEKRFAKQYGIEKDEMVLVYVGRMAKEKNIEELLWHQKSVQDNVKLVLVGDGPYRDDTGKEGKRISSRQTVNLYRNGVAR